MKKNVFLWLCLLIIQQATAQNLALCLDGRDNNVRTGIGFLQAPWTLEAWIKGDDTSWKETEVIFGGGEYSTYSHADNFPLVVKQGKLHSTRAGLTASGWLDDKWHHVALTCNGQSVSLYVDGALEAHKDTVVTILPGAIGVSEEGESVFGGQIDEVRIWNAALTAQELQSWMYIPLEAKHEKIQHLVAYYNFDAGIDDTALNWVGSGYRSYHLRNGRVDYAGASKLAYTIPNTNDKFKPYTGPQRLFNAITIGTEWDADRATNENQLLKLRITVQGSTQPLVLEEMILDLSGTDRLNDLSALHIYYTGQTARSTRRDVLASVSPRKKIRILLPEEKQVKLSEGANYVLVTVDIPKDARLGNKLSLGVSSFTLSGQKITPQPSKSAIVPQITENASTNPDVFRVLQWNIWHGGRHVPLQGRQRIIELLQASKADVITMQEAYGFQEEIAAALQYNLLTASSKDNLSLFSRFPLEKQTTGSSFCSNPAIVKAGEGRPLLVDACWVRYSYRPDYTGSFPDPTHKPDGWVAEDSILPMADSRRMLDEDLAPVLAKQEMPVILGGDFNSCSHLDWTERASQLHAGYGPVAFPTSRFLLERGYKDSFREVHPDEVARPEGTFAGIYGQLDFSRIDFIYYKGGIRAVSSKIVQTAPEIDDIWASDHSAVLTTFKWE